MFCRNCGQELKEGELFCGGCGTKREETNIVEPIEPMPTATVTEETQAPYQPPPLESSSQPTQPSQEPYQPPMAPPPRRTAPPARKTGAKKKPIALICIIAAVVVALGAGAYFLFFHGDNGGGDGISGPRAIPNEARIMMELSQDGRSIIPREQTVTGVEILAYETNRDEWTHFAAVLVNSEDSEVAYTKHATMLYYRDEDREWVLLAIEPDRTDLWLRSPLAGVNTAVLEDTARNVLNFQQLTIGGEEWFIDENTIESVTITSQNTDLNNRRDAATATVVLGSDAMTAQGQIEITFIFDDGWVVENYGALTPFTSDYRPNAIFELSDEQLLDELVRHDATILREMVFEGQTMTLAREEISNLSISDYESSNKGANRVYNFSFNVEKGVITYAVNAQAFYHFDSMSGWMISDIGFSFSPAIASVDLAGTRWVGTYNPPHPQRGLTVTNTRDRLIIEIVELTADGAIRAILSGFPPELSHTAIGTFDLATLSINLIFEEWIVEPPDAPRSVVGIRDDPQRVIEPWQINLTGQLSADGTSISRARGFGVRNPFDVTLTDEVLEPDDSDDSEEPDDSEDDDEE